MKRNQKLIIGIVLIGVIAISGSLVTWFLFFSEKPFGELPKYPDLTISNYSLEEDNLTVSITNIGESNTNLVIILAEIESLPLSLYNNSQTPIDLDINEVFIFSIDLKGFVSHFDSGTTYTIKIQVDPYNSINEMLENNNEITVEYYYEKEAPPFFDIFSPNTYCFNSSINDLGYAVVFNATQIVLEDSLIISNGNINGYNVVNSTILNKTNITDSFIPISITLYGDQNLTIRNIWDLRINVILCNNSKLSLFNSTIRQVATIGFNNVLFSNSTIEFFTSAQTLITLSNLRIINNSSLNYCIISSPTSLEIEYSKIHTFYIIATSNPYTQQKGYYITGNIKNCTIYGLQSYGQTNLNIYGTKISQIAIIGNTKLTLVDCIVTEEYVIQQALCILNNSKILSELRYGIIVSSNSVNITNGQVQGTSYTNNTLLINANVSKTTLMSVLVNKTGKVLISNFSCNIFLYDDAKVIINDTNPSSSDSYGAYVEGSSELVGINSSLGFILCQENSSLDLSEECTIQSLFVNSSNNISIKNSTILYIGWYSEPLEDYHAKIINSNIEEFHALPSCGVDIINCSIETLYEGIIFQSGMNFYNTTGIYGAGSISDYLNITGSVINNRIYKYIEISGDATVIIKDMHNLFSISIESGILMLSNCTIVSLQMKNNAIAYLNNCTSPTLGAYGMMYASLFGPQAFMCLDNSHLYINNTKMMDGNLMMFYNNAQATITDSLVYAIYIFQEARVNITYSDLWMISVAASSSIGYALSILHCTTEILFTISWNFFIEFAAYVVI